MTEATLEIEAGRYDSAVRKAQHAVKVAQASSDPMAVVLSERIMAQTLHFRGQHETARTLARKVLGHADKAIPLAHQPLAVDHRVSMRIVLARIAWIEGSFYQARQIADESLEYAADDSPFSLCQALTLAACPIAFWQGDYSRARSLTARLLEEASRYRLGYWHAYGEWYERVTTAPAKPAVSAARFPLSGLLSDTLMTIDPNLVPERGKAPARESASGWGAPELLRVQGERLLRVRRAGRPFQSRSLVRQGRGDRTDPGRLGLATSCGHQPGRLLAAARTVRAGAAGVIRGASQDHTGT